VLLRTKCAFEGLLETGDDEAESAEGRVSEDRDQREKLAIQGEGDDRMRRCASRKAGRFCPTIPRPTVQVNAYGEPFKIDAHGMRTLQIASARLDWDSHQLAGI
jgi:hypothetical protein